MLPSRRPSRSLVPLLCSGLLLAVGGCGPGGSTNPTNTNKFENAAPSTSSAPAAPPSAEANSFDEVAARLDRGGEFYLYLSTAQWLDGLSTQVGKLHDALPLKDMSAEDRKQVEQLFNVSTTFIKNTGIEAITGVGASSLAVEPGVYRNTVFTHHYKGKETGLLNTLFGTAPHALTALDLLPADTALASSGDYDLAGLVRLILQTIDQSGIPEWKQGKADALAKFQAATGLTSDEFLASLGSEIDIVLTLDPAKQVEVPGAVAAPMKIPAPRLALMFEVKDDKLFNKLDAQLAQMPPMIKIVKVDEPGLKMRTGSYPATPSFELRPTVARWDKFIIIASDDHLIRDMIAAQKGGGFKASPAFAKLSSGLPAQGNGFTLSTRLFADTVRNLQQQAFAQDKTMTPAQMELLSKYLLASTSADSYGVSGHVENGWLTVNKGSAGVGKLLTPLLIVPVGIAAGVALPVFSAVQEKGKATKSLAQAKQIGLALKLYAGDYDGKYPPSLDALGPQYLSSKKVFVSPFAPDEPMGYVYHPGLTDSSPADAVIIEDKFAPAVAKQRVIVHLDNSGEVTKVADE